MKIAICYRGIHYTNNYVTTDYRKTYKNHQDFFINPLKENNKIDIFLITYQSDIINELINDYNPVDKYVCNINELYNGSSWERQLIFHNKLIDIVKNYEKSKNIKYDMVIILRYDIYFKININQWNIDFNKINFTHRHSDCNNTCDNIHIIPRIYLEDFNNAVNICYTNNKITHEINNFIDKDKYHFCYIINCDENDEYNKANSHYIIERTHNR